ncbi:MAG: hypothetical protein M3290_10310, partial [Actinomycetota bacterium]|nr:hypothetical protein [Actinomycetota bacterium]
MPEPDATLYVLYNSKKDDYFTTTSATEADQMKGQGYTVGTSGDLFLKQIDNTIPITLDAGVGYVWKSQQVAPTGANVTPLYKL